MMLRALLADMSLVSFDGSVARLRCQPTVRGVAEKKLADLSKLMSSLCGASVRAELVETDTQPAAGDSGDGAEAESGDGAAFEPDIDHPIVKKTIEIFNGRIVEVKPVRTKPLDD